MKCDFCQRDENSIQNVFFAVFSIYEKQIKTLGMQISTFKEHYAKENGFVPENFEKAKNIRKTFLKMKINSILNELDNFLEEEPNINLLTNYFENHTPDIAAEKPMIDLLNLYIKEPTQTRLDNAVRDISNEKNNLQRICNKIKAKHDVFSDIEVVFEIPLHVFDYEQDIMLHLLQNMTKIPGTNNKTNSKKMHLCPYCAYLFKQFSQEINNIDLEYRPTHSNGFSLAGENYEYTDPNPLEE